MRCSGAPLARRIALAIMITACGRPSEQTLVDQFPTVRPTLDTLRAMAEEDTSLVRIARDFVDPPSPTVTTARWNRYRQLLERLHSEAGLTRMPDHVVDIAIGTSGLAVSGSSNGYIYFPTPPSPAQIRPTLADTPAGSTSYRLLSGGWYLYMRR